MAFFRDYLLSRNQTPDTTFNETDEAALVYFLLQARFNRSAEGITLPPGFQPPANVAGLAPETATEEQLYFVAAFLCFFVSKPVGYMNELRAFRQYFIRGFASDPDKQTQLGKALRPAFFLAGLDDLTSADSLNLFFDVDAISAEANAYA